MMNPIIQEERNAHSQQHSTYGKDGSSMPKAFRIRIENMHMDMVAAATRQRIFKRAGTLFPLSELALIPISLASHT